MNELVMLKVMTIVGTRPEIIKLSRVMAELDKYTEHIIVHTGQNFDYELNEIFFKELHIRKPDYFLDAGFLPAGDYDYTARAKNGAEEYMSRGRFAVADIQLENLQLPANLELLRNLSRTYDGRFYYAGSAYAPQNAVWKQILQDIEDRPDLKPVISFREAYASFLDQIWLLILLLGLLSMEYFARKIFGNL